MFDSTCETPLPLTLPLCAQLQPQQVVDHRAKASEALVSHDAPVHGLQDAKRLSDLTTSQPLLQQLPGTDVAPTQSPCHTEFGDLLLLIMALKKKSLK